MKTQKYYTSTGLRLDLRKLHSDDSGYLKENYPDATSEETIRFVDELVLDYYNDFGKRVAH